MDALLLVCLGVALSCGLLSRRAIPKELAARGFALREWVEIFSLLPGNDSDCYSGCFIYQLTLPRVLSGFLP